MTTIGSICSKCDTIKKSGKLSCCAPGGSWFKNCGASGNSNTEYTWFEGVQACKDVVSLQSQNSIDSTLVATYDVPTGNSKNYDRLLDVIVFATSILLVHHTI